MKKTFILIIIISLLSCNSTKTTTEKKCKSLSANAYSEVLIDRFKSVTKSKTLELNEIKFKCVYSQMNTMKIMYDEFGHWDKAIYPNGSYHPMLIWNDVQLFQNDNAKYTIGTYGIETVEDIFASVIVMDKEYRDLLTNISLRSKIVEYFSNKIISNDSKNEKFYIEYWKKLNPENWNKLKNYRNKY